MGKEVRKKEEVGKEVRKKEEVGKGLAKQEGTCNDDELEEMLSKLVVPPSSLPPDVSLSTSEDSSDSSQEPPNEISTSGGPLDTLAILRKRLEESVLEDDLRSSGGDSPETKTEITSKSKGEVDNEECVSDTICILPPTPTTSKECFGSCDEGTTRFPNPMDSLTVGGKAGCTAQASVTLHSDEPIVGLDEEDEGTDQGHVFSPASARCSPDLKIVSMWGGVLGGEGGGG